MTPRRWRSSVAIAGVLLALTGCADGDGSGDLAASDACGEVERPTVQDGGHLIGDQAPPVPYSSTPASSGWHRGGAPPTGVHDTPLSDPEIVSVLHVGGVVAAYDPAALPPADVQVLEELPSGPDLLTVTPYDGDMGAPLTLVAWGVVQRCAEVDADHVRAFVDEFTGLLGDH